MDALFGSEWSKQVQKFNYHLSSSGKHESEKAVKAVDSHREFEVSLHSRFQITSEGQPQKSKVFSFTAFNQQMPVQVSLFFYDYDHLRVKVIGQKPVFSYRVSSIYKLPLSERQFTSLIFHSSFICLESENLYISIDFSCQKEIGIVVQFSKYESDVLNLLKGQKRLSTAYWKPTIINRAELQEPMQVGLFAFLERVIKEVPLDQQIRTFTNRNRVTQDVFQFLENPLNFAEIVPEQQIRMDVQGYFLKKQRATYKQIESKDVEIQYSQPINSNQRLSISLYCYDFPSAIHLFSTQDLIFPFERLTLLKKPICQGQRTNLFCKQLILVLECGQYFMSLEVNAENREVAMQVSKQEEDLLTRLRGGRRFASDYWKCSELKTAKLRQSRVYSYEKLIQLIISSFCGGSFFGGWKASNDTLHNIFQVLSR